MSGIGLFWFYGLWLKTLFPALSKVGFYLKRLGFKIKLLRQRDKDWVIECFFFKKVCVSEEYGQAGALKSLCVFAFSRSRKMLGGWRLADWQPFSETLIRGLAPTTCLALYFTALSLGIAATSDTLTRTHHTHITHGGKNQPLTINRSPGSLRAGHGG